MVDVVPLTPDFYRYSWQPLAWVEMQGRFLNLGWPDGATLRAYDHWLWENSIGLGVDVATRECIVDPADLGRTPPIHAAAVTGDGALAVAWTAEDDERAVYHPGWLRHVADGLHRPDAWLPEPVPWTATDLPEPPTHDGPAVLADEAVRADWVDDLLRYGIARLRDLPTDPDTGLQLAAHLGPVRATNFGPIWDVTADVRPSSTANTNIRLGPHTDLPTRETPPGFQFLHCVANSVAGGESTMADGAAVVAHLAEHHPDHHEALTTLRWVFFNRGEGVDHRWSGPIVDLGVRGSPLTLRAFYPVRGFPDMDEADVPRAYDALRCFSEVAADERFQLRYPFRPGDLVAFDNRRILHGRERFGSAGHRRLRGFYMDHDDVRSYARVANRNRTVQRGARHDDP